MKLTRSQAASALTGAAALLVSLNQALPSLLAVPGFHLPAHLVTAIQVAGIAVPMCCRSLLPANSGQGAGQLRPTGREQRQGDRP